MKKILFAASEGVPFIKTGGLADVVQVLCQSILTRSILMSECYDSEVYRVCSRKNGAIRLKYVTHFYMDFNWQNCVRRCIWKRIDDGIALLFH